MGKLLATKILGLTVNNSIAFNFSLKAEYHIPIMKECWFESSKKNTIGYDDSTRIIQHSDRRQ